MRSVYATRPGAVNGVGRHYMAFWCGVAPLHAELRAEIRPIFLPGEAPCGSSARRKCSFNVREDSPAAGLWPSRGGWGGTAIHERCGAPSRAPDVTCANARNGTLRGANDAVS